MVFSISVHKHVTRCESAVRFQEPCVYAGRSRSALPNEDRPTVLQECDFGVLLIANTLLVHSKHAKRSGEVAVDPPSADPETITIGSVVLPNQITPRSVDADLRENLVPWQRACD